MAQSYGNSSTSTIYSFSDIITGLTTTSQELGTSVSGPNPAQTTLVDSFSINLDGDGAQTVSLFAHSNPYLIASDIEYEVRHLTANTPGNQPAYDNFTARYDNSLSKYILSSGTAGTASSSCVVTNGSGTAAVNFKLGVANGGSEAATGSEVATYVFSYQFTNGTGDIATAEVTVHSSELTTPGDVSEAKAKANIAASQMKQQRYNTDLYTTSVGDNSQNGPVSL